MKKLLLANLDRTFSALLVLLGIVVLTLGWIGASGHGLAAEQTPYLISGGLGGFALIAVGCTLWVSADLQDQWRRLDRLDATISNAMSRGPSPEQSTPLDGPTAPEAASVRRRPRQKVGAGTSRGAQDDR